MTRVRILALAALFWVGTFVYPVSAAEPGPTDTVLVTVTQAIPGNSTSPTMHVPLGGVVVGIVGSETTLGTTDDDGQVFFAANPGQYTIEVVDLPGAVEVGANCLSVTELTVADVEDQWQWDVITWDPNDALTELEGGSLWAFQGCGFDPGPVMRIFRSTSPAQPPAVEEETAPEPVTNPSAPNVVEEGAPAVVTAEDDSGSGDASSFPVLPAAAGAVVLGGVGYVVATRRKKNPSDGVDPKAVLTAEDDGLEGRRPVVITPDDASLKRTVDKAMNTTGKTVWLDANRSDGRIMLAVAVGLDGTLLHPPGLRAEPTQAPTVLRITIDPAAGRDNEGGARIVIAAYDTRSDRLIQQVSSTDSRGKTEAEALEEALKAMKTGDLPSRTRRVGDWPVEQRWLTEPPPPEPPLGPSLTEAIEELRPPDSEGLVGAVETFAVDRGTLLAAEPLLVLPVEVPTGAASVINIYGESALVPPKQGEPSILVAGPLAVVEEAPVGDGVQVENGELEYFEWQPKRDLRPEYQIHQHETRVLLRNAKNWRGLNTFGALLGDALGHTANFRDADPDHDIPWNPYRVMPIGRPQPATDEDPWWNQSADPSAEPSTNSLEGLDEDPPVL